MEAESPFTKNGLRFAWDATALDKMVCPRKYQLWNQGWQARGAPLAREFGSAVHECLALHDRCLAKGLSPDHAKAHAMSETARLAVELGSKLPRPSEGAPSREKARSKENLLRTVIWYADHWHNDPAKVACDPEGKPLVECAFRLPLGFETPCGEHEYLLCGYFDGIVEMVGGLWVRERKTTGSTISQHYFDGFSPDTQISTYCLASRVVVPDQPVKGVLLDAIQIAVNFTRFARGLVIRTTEQIDEWAQNVRYWIKVAEWCFLTFGDKPWPMNEAACHLYGGCPYRKVCSKSPSTREQFLQADYVREDPWNPLLDR